MLLGFKDRAELAGGDYTSVTSVMEGVVVVEKKVEAAASDSSAPMAIEGQ